MTVLRLGAAAALAAAAVALLALAARCLFLRRRQPRRTRPASTLVVFGSGGHTAEMLCLLQALPRERYWPLTYVAAETDTTSEARAKAAKAIPADARILRIPRSREVGQSYVTALWSTAAALVATVRLVAAVRPDVVLVNGPGTCLPVCLAAVGLSALGVADARVVFVESVCRVGSLSLTGRLLYALRLADQVQVQWPQLHAKYPRSVYVGMLS